MYTETKIIAREENFGYTLFNKPKLRYRFVTHEGLDTALQDYGVSKNDCEFMPLKPGKIPIRTDILRAPIRIYVETTLGCNRKCRYCFNNSGQPREDELSTGEIVTGLEHLKDEGVIDARFTGGEITRRKDWVTILRTAKELGFAVSCNTNGFYTDKTIPEKFAALGLEQVTVSIDGNQEHHDIVRGKGAYQRTVNNLERMHKSGVRLRINTLVSKFSLNDVKSVLDLASRYTDEINFFAIVFIGRGAELAATDSVTEAEHLRMSREIESLKPGYPNLNILHFAQVSRNTSINPILREHLGLEVGAPSGSTTFNLLSDGRYAFSGYVPYIDPSCYLGNIKVDRLSDVWQNNKRLDQIRSDSKRLMLFCNECVEYTGNRCQGSKYEIELDRLLRPGATNPWCVYGDGPSLLTLAGK